MEHSDIKFSKNSLKREYLSLTQNNIQMLSNNRLGLLERNVHYNGNYDATHQEEWTNIDRISKMEYSECKFKNYPTESMNYSNFNHWNNNGKSKSPKIEMKEMKCTENSSELLKKPPEKLDQKEIEFIEDTIDLFKLPQDFHEWNDKNIEDWFYWIRHKLRFKFPKISKETIDFKKENSKNENTWKGKFGLEAGKCMFKEFSSWLEYVKSSPESGRKHGSNSFLNEYNKTLIDKPRRRNEKKDGLYLWQILLTMLFKKEECADFITWTDHTSGMFKIKDPQAVSLIWGESKGNPKMTYDKMSRSMRQYYKSNLLKKTNHDKLNYCFNMDDNSVKKFIKRCSEGLPYIKIPPNIHQRSNS